MSKALSWHYNDVIMSAMMSQITSASIVHSTVCSGAEQRKHQSSASLGFVRGIHRWPVNSSHKGPVTRKMFPFDDVIMTKNCISLKLVLKWQSDNFVFPKSSKGTRNKLKRNSNQSAMVFMGKMLKKIACKKVAYIVSASMGLMINRRGIW